MALLTRQSSEEHLGCLPFSDADVLPRSGNRIGLPTFGMIWMWPPHSNSGKWSFWGSLTKNVIILVVTVTGRGDNLWYDYVWLSSKNQHDLTAEFSQDMRPDHVNVNFTIKRKKYQTSQIESHTHGRMLLHMRHLDMFWQPPARNQSELPLLFVCMSDHRAK